MLAERTHKPSKGMSSRDNRLTVRRSLEQKLMTISISFHHQHCVVHNLLIITHLKAASDTSEATLHHWIKNLAERKALDISLQQKAEELSKMNETLKKEIQEREYAQVWTSK